MPKPKGKCLRCGQCCMEAYRFGYDAEIIDKEKGIYRNIKFKKINPKNKTSMPCSKLIFDIKTKKAICLLHPHKKSSICKGYPFTTKEIIFKGCGYKKG